MRHRDRIDLGSSACHRCGKEMASGKGIEVHETWCKAKKLEWIVCFVCNARYAVKWNHKCYHKYCVKCSTHYRDTVDHRCFICKDKHRREADDSDGETLSEGDEEVTFFNKVEKPVQQDKRQKGDAESRHYAYDIESMLLCTPQQDGTT